MTRPRLLPDDTVVFTGPHWKYLQSIGRAGQRQDRRTVFGRVVAASEELVYVLWDRNGRMTTHFTCHLERRDNHA